LTTLADVPAPGDRRRSIASWSAALAAVVVAAGLAFWGAGRTPTIDAPYAAYLPTEEQPQWVAFAGQNPGVGTLSVAVESPSGLTGVPNQRLAEQVKVAAREAGEPAGAPVVQRTMLASDRAGGSTAVMGLALRLPGGLARVGYWFGGGGITWYEPPFIELPADPKPGARWSSEGKLFGEYSYRLDGRVEPEVGIDGECIRVLLTLRQQDRQGSWTTLEDATTWCRGRGVVRSEVIGTGEVMSLLESRPAILPSWSSVSLDPPLPVKTAFGMPGVAFLVQPAVSMAGVLVAADGVSHDLVAVRLATTPAQFPESLPTLDVSWIQHPGGSILGMAGEDDFIVVATSTRKLMAFDASGQLLWSSPMSDAASGPPVLTADLVVVPTMNARIDAYSREDGQTLWQHRMPDVVDVPIAVIPGEPSTDNPIAQDRIIVSDASGNLRLLDGDGSVRWSIEEGVTPTTIAVLADGAVLLEGSDDGLALISWRASQGGEDSGSDVVQISWQQDLQGSIVAPAVLLDGQVIVPTEDALIGLDRQTGELRWVRSELPDARVIEWGGRLLGTSGSAMFQLDTRGNVLALETFIEDGRKFRRLMPIAIDDGMLVVSDDGLLRRWLGTDD